MSYPNKREIIQEILDKMVSFFGVLLIGTAHRLFSGRFGKIHRQAPKIVPPVISDAKSDRPALQGGIVRGYDNIELFREDLWLIEQSRKQLVAPEASMYLITRSVGVGEQDVKRICTLLAQYPGTKFNN